VLTQVTQLTGLASLPNSSSILDWLGNEIHGLFFFLLSIGLSQTQINIFFLKLVLDFANI